MLVQQTPHTETEWRTGVQVWDAFTDRHPELGFNKGKWAFHNFLRPYRQALVQADAIRLVRNRFWLAHQDRFYETAFDCATGKFNSTELNTPAGVPGTVTVAHFSQAHIDTPQPIVVQGLLPDEHLQRFGQIKADMAEPLLVQYAQLLTVARAASQALPGCLWQADAMNPVDRQRLQSLQMALMALA